MSKNLPPLLSIILLLFFYVSSLNAQEDSLTQHEKQWMQINSAVLNAYQNGNYQEGIQLAEKAYLYAKQHLAKQHLFIRVSMKNLAKFYKYEGRYTEAEQMLRGALQLSENYEVR